MKRFHASPYGGHFVGFYWPTLFKDHFEWVKHYDACQRIDNISRRNETPL